MNRALAGAVAVVVGGACKFPDLPPVDEDSGTADGPVACATAGPDPSCPAGTPVCLDGTCSGLCTADTDCAGRPLAESVCLESLGACVACDEIDVQAVPASSECPTETLAVCDGETHVCRACEAHDECLSGVCAAGRCAGDAEVVRMSTTGTDSPSCGWRSEPCLTLNAAIDRIEASSALRYILMPGDATRYLTSPTMATAVFDAIEVTVVGYGARLGRTGTGPIIDIRNGSNVRIEGLTVADASGALVGTAIQVSGASTLALYEAAVRDNAYRGVSGDDATFQLLRSRFINNSGGGVRLDGGNATIVNNVIVGNGNPNSAYGGLSLYFTRTPSRVEFNTLVMNVSASGTADTMSCGGVEGAQVDARNNILIGFGANPRVLGNCVHTFSLFTPGGATLGNGNANVADVATYMFTADYHLQPGSVAAGRAQATGLVGESAFDIDGDPRGTINVDVGADEIP